MTSSSTPPFSLNKEVSSHLDCSLDVESAVQRVTGQFLDELAHSRFTLPVKSNKQSRGVGAGGRRGSACPSLGVKGSLRRRGEDAFTAEIFPKLVFRNHKGGNKN